MIGTLGQTGNANPACFGSCAITPYVHFEISATVPPLADERPRCDPQDYLVNLPPPSGSTPPAPGLRALPRRTSCSRRSAAWPSRPPTSWSCWSGLPALPGGQVSLRAAWKVGDVVPAPALGALRHRPRSDAPGQRSIPIDPLGAPAELDSQRRAASHLSAGGPAGPGHGHRADSGGSPRDVSVAHRRHGLLHHQRRDRDVDQDGQVTAVGSGRPSCRPPTTARPRPSP